MGAWLKYCRYEGLWQDAYRESNAPTAKQNDAIKFLASAKLHQFPPDFIKIELVGDGVGLIKPAENRPF